MAKLSERVENTMGNKREIARYEQFLLFPQCLQMACFQGASKGVVVWEWVKRAFGELNNILLRTCLIKFSHNSQRMSDSLYRITESSELD